MSIDDVVHKYLDSYGPNEQLEVLLNETPEGWDKSSIEKFAKTIGTKGAKEKGFFAACVAKMKTKGLDDPEGFCADLKDKAWGTTNWRGKGKKKSEVKK